MNLRELFEAKKLDVPTPTVAELAKKHGVSTDRVERELAKGIEVEMEHTTDPKVAREIALDHLGEKLDYYKRLKKVEESKQSPDTLINYFRKFFDICMKELKLDTLPKIEWVSSDDLAKEKHTFGILKNKAGVIRIQLTDRHPLDVMRTLAHELVHYRQLLDGRLDKNSGKTGSDIENEAHAIAGVIMRKFDDAYPEAFHLEPLAESTLGEVADSPYRYVLWKRTMNGNSYLFQTDNGQEMVVSIVPEQLGKDRHQIEVMFADKKDFGLEKTGKGDAFRIFATVAQILKDYIKDAKFNIAQIFFTGKTSEPSRIKLYDRIARSLGDHIPGYKFIGSTGRPGMGERGYYFEKIRKRKKKEVEENFADGKKPGRKGLSRKVGIPKKATLGQLEKITQSSSGERRKMAQWQLNMRRGKQKKK